MKILVVDPNPVEREATVRILTEGRHEVVAAVDLTAALALCAQGTIDALAVELVTPARGSLDFVRRLRGRETKAHPYIVMTASRATPGDFGEAFNAGADDFLRKPLVREELLVRIDGLARIRKWVLRAFGDAGAEAKVNDPSSLAAWSRMDTEICEQVGEMAGCTLAVAPGETMRDGAIFAQIPLHLPFEGHQVTFRVGVDRASRGPIAAQMLGDANAGEASIRDLLREVANTAGGAFKRMTIPESKTFTMGIPADVRALEASAVEPRATKQWTAVGPNGIAFHFRAEVLAGTNNLVRAASLREGMVLAQDLVNASGALLLPGGTRLTLAHLEHLPKAVGTSTLIEVAHAA